MAHAHPEIPAAPDGIDKGTMHEVAKNIRQTDDLGFPLVLKRAFVTIVVGITAGLGGMVLALLLHEVQHLAYGYSLHAVISQESFLEGVSAASPERRIIALIVCGLIAGIGWWFVYNRCRPLVSIKKAVDSGNARMPAVATTAHALLQIITVALGSPLGREVAPREIGALFASWISAKAGLSPAEAKTMIACGAGAGLAAVYNVPLAGALFTVEALLGSIAPSVVVPALATSVIAALVAWVGLGDASQYTVPAVHITTPLVILSFICGPIFGFAGTWYTRLATATRKKALKGKRMIFGCVAVFLVIGLVTVMFPQLPGNGKGPLQLGFDSDVPLTLAVCLLIVKLLATTGTLWVGAEGGLLTPGMTIGALLAVCIAELWNMAFPAVTPGAFALIGASAFLAASMKIPATAIVLIFEFTGIGRDFLIPITFAVAGAVGVAQVMGAGQGSHRSWLSPHAWRHALSRGGV